MDFVPLLETSVRLALFLGVLLTAGIGTLSLFRACRGGAAGNLVWAASCAGALIIIVVIKHFR
jgi:hypothetical protein